MNRFIKLILFINLLSFISAYACTYNNCNEDETVIIFFNGVNNDEEQAVKSTKALQERFGDKAKDGTKLKYDYFYNTSVNAKIDIIEALDQRLRSQGSNLVKRYETINPFARNEFNFALILAYGNVPNPFTPIIFEIHSTLASASKSVKNYLVSSLDQSPTYSDYKRHNDELDKLMKQGKKILFVAHSQGNIFANQAYEHAMSRSYNKNAIKVVHIAPASTNLKGDYVLSNLDNIIGDYLRISLTGEVPKANYHFDTYIDEFNNCSTNENIQVCLARKSDSFGHGLNEIYLNSKLGISKITEKLISDNLDSLNCLT